MKNFYKRHIFICNNKRTDGKTHCGYDDFSVDCYRYLKDKIRDENLLGRNKLGVTSTKCLGRCDIGPIMVIYPDNIWYKYRSIDDIDLIIEKHLLFGKIVQHLQAP